ncbi:MAG: hypothetical protein ACI3XC_10785 [Phascolarctobacterium sp.]
MYRDIDSVKDFVVDTARILDDSHSNELSCGLIEKYRACVDLLCEAKVDVGYKAKAYGSYMGNAAYPVDYKIAEENFLLLLKKFQDPYAANALGFIYYYGRTSGGKADYNKAFKYFTFAALADVAEARYKLCDLMVLGKGFPCKAPDMAYSILLDMYNDFLLSEFCCGNFACECADVAIRLGRIDLVRAKKRRNLKVMTRAYNYLLIAHYALVKRMEYDKQTGDDSVMERLLPELDEAKELYHKQLQGHLDNDAVPAEITLLDRFISSGDIKLAISKADSNSYNISFIHEEDGEYAYNQLVVVPEMDFCSFVSKIVINVTKEPKIYASIENIRLDSLIFSDKKLDFYQSDEDGEKLVMSIKPQGLKITQVK